MSTVETFIAERASDGLLAWPDQFEVSHRFDLSVAETEQRVLECGVLPARLQRNRSCISVEGQLKLFRSQVAVVGCGGLGGYVVEELARLGVGGIVAIDPDVFEEHNLNRQCLSTVGNLGEPKVSAALQRIAEINPAARLTPHQERLCAENARELLAGSQVVIDGLDCIGTRLELADACTALGVPLVHGAIAGWFGQVASIFPGENTMAAIYPPETSSGKGVESSLGNPSFAPAVIAGLMVAEACKILLGEAPAARPGHLIVDLMQMEMHAIRHA